jgi:hypothetical protein
MRINHRFDFWLHHFQRKVFNFPEPVFVCYEHSYDSPAAIVSIKSDDVCGRLTKSGWLVLSR